jgi:hypothetical protein
MDSPARIATLQSQIKGLLKKIQALRKALMEEPKEKDTWEDAYGQ